MEQVPFKTILQNLINDKEMIPNPIFKFGLKNLNSQKKENVPASRFLVYPNFNLYQR